MKKIVLGSIVVGVCFAGCNKPENGPLRSYWTVGYIASTSQVAVSETMRTYSSLKTTLTGSSLKAENGTHSISFLFSGAAAPTAGVYKLVGGMPDSGEVTFKITGVYSGSNYDYGATGGDTASVSVSIQNNKLSLEMPVDWAKSNSSGRSDSVLVTAKLIED